MSDIKMKASTGYCRKRGRQIPVCYTFYDSGWVQMDCDPASCKFTRFCDLYQNPPRGET